MIVLRLRALNIKKIFKQFFRFIALSGVGFSIDFCVYYFLTEFVGFPVAHANMVSSIPAVTYVFLLSTRKVFIESKSKKMKLGYKYIIYLSYQAILVYLVSILAQKLYNVYIDCFITSNINISYVKLIIKCLITPITMTCNFIFMKILSEKV